MPSLKANGIEIHYKRAGNGPALLLIHNVTANTDAFADNIPELSAHYDVIACDLRGHGKTTKVPAGADPTEFYDFDRIAGDLTELLDHLGVAQFFLLGQAYWGVSTALTLFCKNHTRVRGIIAASCNIIASEPQGNPYDNLGPQARANFIRMQEVASTQGMAALFEERKKTKTFWTQRLLSNPNILARFSDMHLQTCPQAFCNFPKVSPESHKQMRETLRQTGVPLLMIMGADDSHNDSMIAAMQADYPETQVVMIHAAGHYPAIENPNGFNAATLNFLAGCQMYGDHAARSKIASRHTSTPGWPAPAPLG